MYFKIACDKIMLTITENETIWKEELTDKNYCAYFCSNGGET